MFCCRNKTDYITQLSQMKYSVACFVISEVLKVIYSYHIPTSSNIYVTY